MFLFSIGNWLNVSVKSSLEPIALASSVRIQENQDCFYFAKCLKSVPWSMIIREFISLVKCMSFFFSSTCNCSNPINLDFFCGG